MLTNLDDVEFETCTIGPLVLTTPVLRKLGLREIVDRHCPIAEQADMGHGLVAELVVQCRLTEPTALYDMPEWATRYGITGLYPALTAAGQLNDDRVGRLLDVLYAQRAVIWGELIGRAARLYGVEFRRLHADSAPIKFAGAFAEQAAVEGVPCLEPGYNPQGEWVQQLKLFALATGDGGLPVWFEALNGGAGDSPQYVPQFEAFCEHARLASWLPLHEVIVIGDRKMPTVENQLAWLRLGVSYIGPVTMQETHRETLRDLLKAGQTWRELPYVAQRDAKKERSERTVYAGLSHTVQVTDPESGIQYLVRHLYIRSSALATHAAQRRQAEMTAIEREIQRIQQLVNKYDYTTPEIIAQRVQQKAFKKRAAQRYFALEVRVHTDRPTAPLELCYTVDHARVRQEAELDGVYLLVAGGAVASWEDAAVLQEWKGQYKVEHCFRLTNQLFLVGPLFLKTAARIASLLFLIMVGCLVAGLLERQVRQALTARQEPIRGLMPEGRDTLRPTVPRILKAFAQYSLVIVRNQAGVIVAQQFGKLNAVQAQILQVLEMAHPAAVFG
ncbi:MAG: IS1634 family transposase [Anaerolineae bacterium]|jgi:transposase|nr:IS1634 family transposase [Anaerolineae bacterium]